MCDPFTMISAAVSVASGAASYVGQQQQAKAARDAANRAYQIDREAAIARQNEEAVSTAQKLMDNQRAALRATSTATVSAGESGAYGNSVNRLLQSIGMQEGTIATRELINLENTNRSLEFQNRSALVRRDNTIIQNPKPNFLGTALSVGGDIFDAYNRFNPKPPTK
jgi:hypothetical protein